MVDINHRAGVPIWTDSCGIAFFSDGLQRIAQSPMVCVWIMHSISHQLCFGTVYCCKQPAYEPCIHSENTFRHPKHSRQREIWLDNLMQNHQLVIAPRCLELNGVGVISEIVPALCCVDEFIHLVSMVSEAVLEMLMGFRGLRVMDTDGYGLHATDVAIQILQLITGEFWFAPAIELLWFHNIWFVLLSLHEQQIIVKDGLWLLCTEMELVFSAKRPWVTHLCFELVYFNERPMVQQNQFCLKSLPSQEGAAIRVSTELISVTRTWSLHGFLLFTVMLNANGDEDFAKRWTMFHNGCHVLIQSQSRDFEFIGHIIAACSGWFESFLTFFYGSSPRPPDDRCHI